MVTVYGNTEWSHSICDRHYFLQSFTTAAKKTSKLCSTNPLYRNPRHPPDYLTVAVSFFIYFSDVSEDKAEDGKMAVVKCGYPVCGFADVAMCKMRMFMRRKIRILPRVGHIHRLHQWEKLTGGYVGTGGRHYSDRLCSDRRYSDNPQSGRPCTSLVCLGICRNGRNLEKIGGGW